MSIEKEKEAIKNGFLQKLEFDIEQLKDDIQIFLTYYPNERENIENLIKKLQ